MATRRRDRGESLIEIVITVMIIGIAVTALVSGLATSAAAGGAHRVDVSTDAAMRNLAEATKSAARACAPGVPLAIDFAPPPDGYSASIEPAEPTCPDVEETTTVVLTVTGPTGAADSMEIKVRTP